MRAVRIVAAREFTQTVRTRTFLLTTVLGLLGLVVLSFLPTLLNWLENRSGSRVTEVIVFDQVGGIYPAMVQSLEEISEQGRPQVAFSVPQPDDAALDYEALDEQVKTGELSAYLLITPPESGRREPVIRFGGREISARQINSLEQILRPVVLPLRLADLGLSMQQGTALQRPFLTQVVSHDDRFDSSSQRFASQTLAYLLLFLLYFTLIGYGSVLTNGVAAEKGSRVMEMMLVSVRPRDLLLGKILGLGSASLVQYALWVAVGLGISWARGALSNLSVGGVPLQLSAVSASTVLFFLLYYVLGYLVYSSLFAAAGCLVSRPEEASQTVLPVTLLVVVAYILAIVALDNPGGFVVRLASLVPFLAPTVMFTRIVMSSAPAVEIALSVLFSIVFVWLMLLLGARIYQYSILRTRKAGWLEGLRGNS
jgi:ABC-2 type transport system permease protein